MPTHIHAVLIYRMCVRADGRQSIALAGTGHTQQLTSPDQKQTVTESFAMRGASDSLSVPVRQDTIATACHCGPLRR